jgi:hypothetical protein
LIKNEVPFVLIDILRKKIHRPAKFSIHLKATFLKEVRLDQYCKMELNILEKYYFQAQ